MSLAATGNPLTSTWTKERHEFGQAQLNCIKVNPLREEQRYWNSAAADSCAPWGSCAPGDSCAPGRPACHAASCVPCEHWDSLQTTVHPEDSCVPCGQLCARETAVHTSGSCTHCRRLGYRRTFCSPPPCSVPEHRHVSKAAWQSPLHLISVRMSWVSKDQLSNTILK